jgi:hypothetical protein
MDDTNNGFHRCARVKVVIGVIEFAAILALICGNGCADMSVTLQSNKDTTAIYHVRRLFVFIDQGSFETQPVSKKLAKQLKSDVLAASLKNCLSNTSVQLEIGVVNPLALDDKIYETKIHEFLADSVLTIRIKHVVMDQFGGCPIIYYDASLFDEITHKYIWRALINNSGNPETMDQRMQKMAEAIIAQIRADGFIESQ